MKIPRLPISFGRQKNANRHTTPTTKTTEPPVGHAAYSGVNLLLAIRDHGPQQLIEIDEDINELRRKLDRKMIERDNVAKLVEVAKEAAILKVVA